MIFFQALDFGSLRRYNAYRNARKESEGDMGYNETENAGFKKSQHPPVKAIFGNARQRGCQITIISEDPMTQSKEKEKRRCLFCGKSFPVYRKWAKYCGAKCRLAHWQERHPRVQVSELKKLQTHAGDQGEKSKRVRPTTSQEILTRLDRIEAWLKKTENRCEHIERHLGIRNEVEGS